MQNTNRSHILTWLGLNIITKKLKSRVHPPNRSLLSSPQLFWECGLLCSLSKGDHHCGRSIRGLIWIPHLRQLWQYFCSGAGAWEQFRGKVVASAQFQRWAKYDTWEFLELRKSGFVVHDYNEPITENIYVTTTDDAISDTAIDRKSIAAENCGFDGVNQWRTSGGGVFVPPNRRQ